MNDTVTAGSKIRDALSRISLSVLGFLICAMTISSILIAPAATPHVSLSMAGLFSKICIALFYSMMVWFALVRDRPRAQAAGWQPRVVALLGSFLLMGSLMWLQKAEDIGVVAHTVSAGFLIIGTMLMIIILRQLGKSFSIMAEARQLVTSGPYATIRHPLYVAELVATIGVLIEYFSWIAVAIAAIQFAFQIQRMRNEEAVLTGTFPEYAPYMARTSRLIPRVW